MANDNFRPRLSQETKSILEDIEEELRYLRDEEGKDVSKYYGKMEDVKQDEIVQEALKRLKEEEY